jgi:hypothetical protein
MILEKVSLDKKLFWKEYRKLSRTLINSEYSKLRILVRLQLEMKALTAKA